MLRQHTSLLFRLAGRFMALASIATAAACAIPGPQAAETEAQAKISRQSLMLSNGSSLSYLIAGSPAGNTVIFVHGTPGHAMGWADYLLNVPAGFRFIAIDRPGFGESGPDGAETSLAVQAQAIAELIKSLGDSRVALVGHSLGGPIVVKTAADHPDLVTGLVVLAGSLDPDQEDVPFLQFVGDTWPVSALLPRGIRNANREIIALKPQLEELRKHLPGIRVPVMIVHGTKDDLVPFANVAYMKANMSGSTDMQIATLTDQNHFLPWNSKPQVDQAISKLFPVAVTSGQPR